MPSKNEKKNLYKLILARSDIASALFACRFFIKNVTDIKNELWLPLQEAIIVSYARPFSNNRPLCPLEKSWGLIPDARLQEIHDRALKARDKLSGLLF